jgi:hypothetical protein
MIERVRTAAVSVPRLVGSLYDRSMNRVLAHPYDLASAADAREQLTAAPGDTDGVTSDQIQRIAIVVTPLLRRAGVVDKIPGLKRFPVVLSVVTVANVARSMRLGVRDVQVVGSYLASRVRHETGRAPEPGAVKRMTVQLYLNPSRRPDPARSASSVALLRKWLLNGVLGRGTGKAADKAIRAIERLDVSTVPVSLDVGTVAERTIAPALKAGG